MTASAPLMDKYIFWETNASQVAGDSEYMSNWNIQQMPRLGGAASLNLAGLPENKFGIPIGLTINFPGLQYGGEDTPSLHAGEQDIDYGDEKIYGPEDDPIDVYDSAPATEEEESEPVASVVDAMLYDEMMKKVGPRASHRRSKNTKRTAEKRQHKKTKKGRYAK